jgi:hypothetical protein
MFESGFPADLITRLVLINRLERMRNTSSIIYLEVGRSRLTGTIAFFERTVYSCHVTTINLRSFAPVRGELL